MSKSLTICEGAGELAILMLPAEPTSIRIKLAIAPHLQTDLKLSGYISSR
jgi:hypothetical protein